MNSCPGCHITLAIPDVAVGRQVRCPKCQLVFAVPREAISQAASSVPPTLAVGTGFMPAPTSAPVPPLPAERNAYEDALHDAQEELSREEPEPWTAEPAVLESEARRPDSEGDSPLPARVRTAATWMIRAGIAFAGAIAADLGTALLILAFHKAADEERVAVLARVAFVFGIYAVPLVFIFVGGICLRNCRYLPLVCVGLLCTLVLSVPMFFRIAAASNAIPWYNLTAGLVIVLVAVIQILACGIALLVGLTAFGHVLSVLPRREVRARFAGWRPRALENL